MRGAVVTVKEETYTHAAQSIGARTWHVLWRHILPNIMPVVIVLFTTRIGAVILTEAGLSFLEHTPTSTYMGQHVERHWPHLYVYGPMAGACARVVPDRGGIRYQRLRRCAARPVRPAVCEAADEHALINHGCQRGRVHRLLRPATAR